MQANEKLLKLKKMKKLELLKVQVNQFLEHVTEKEWQQLCENHLHKDTLLGSILTDVCFYEGGFASIENGEFWVTGDDGRQEIELKTLLEL